MAPSTKSQSNGYGFPPEAFDSSGLPDFDTDFLAPADLEAFVQALTAPDPGHSPDDAPARSAVTRSSSTVEVGLTNRRPSAGIDLDNPQAVAAHAAAAAADISGPTVLHKTSNGSAKPPLFIRAQSDWAPVHEKVAGKTGQRRRRRKKVRAGRRTEDETREGYLYSLLKWPFLITVVLWVSGLSAVYLATRVYIAMYEQLVTWRGRREKLRREMRAAPRYAEWVTAAKNLDAYLGNQLWKEENEFAYYDYKTVRRVDAQLKKCLRSAERVEAEIEAGMPLADAGGGEWRRATEDLKVLVEACVKNNFVGVENWRLYSQTYYGTKNLVQNFVEEGTIHINYYNIRGRVVRCTDD